MSNNNNSQQINGSNYDEREELKRFISNKRVVLNVGGVQHEGRKKLTGCYILKLSNYIFFKNKSDVENPRKTSTKPSWSYSLCHMLS